MTYTTRPAVKAPMQTSPGFTLIEVCISGCLLAVSLLFLVGMFATGYTRVTRAGNTTTGLAVARQLLEDVRTLPFDRIANLNGFSTSDPSSLPASDPERRIARRWRYALAGDGTGWNFTSAERTAWAQLANQNGEFSGSGTVQVTAPTTTSARITATVTFAGNSRSFALATVVAQR